MLGLPHIDFEGLSKQAAEFISTAKSIVDEIRALRQQVASLQSDVARQGSEIATIKGQLQRVEQWTVNKPKPL